METTLDAPVKKRVLISKKQLLARVPKADRTIYDWEKRGWFPLRVTLPNGEVAWYEDEIDDWIEGRRSAEFKPRKPAPDTPTA